MGGCLGQSCRAGCGATSVQGAQGGGVPLAAGAAPRRARRVFTDLTQRPGPAGRHPAASPLTLPARPMQAATSLPLNLVCRKENLG